MLCMAGSFVARGESWFAVIRAAMPSAPVSRAVVRRALLIGMVGSTVAPGRLGEAARSWILARRVGNPRETLGAVVGTVLAQTLINLLALIILAALALTGAASTALRVGALVAVIALPVGILAVLFGGPRVLRRAGHTHRPRVGRAARWLLHVLVQVRSGLGVFRQPGPAAHASIAQLTAWSLQLVTCYVVMLALGIEHGALIAAAARSSSR